MKYNHVYVITPCFVTGGPDALHQLVFYLKRLNIKADIVYVGEDNKFKIPIPYQIYIKSFLTLNDIVDDEKNVIITPETHIYYMDMFSKIQKMIWWLSVDNNLKHRTFLNKLFFVSCMPFVLVKNRKLIKGHVFRYIKNRLSLKPYRFYRENSKIIHLCASYYAYDYVSLRSSNKIYKCIEPISKIFLEKYYSLNNIKKLVRQDIVLYNPAKSKKYVTKLIKKFPNIKFEALQGLTQEQLINKYLTSKVYIDFGSFPGAERMPKEAVLFGCAIITGKHGASNYYGDVSIPNEFKLNEKDIKISEVGKKIEESLKNYDNLYSRFDEYRNVVLSLEDSFMISLNKIFKEKE